MDEPRGDDLGRVLRDHEDCKTRLRHLEAQVAVLAARHLILERLVYGAVAIVLSGVLAGVLALVLRAR